MAEPASYHLTESITRQGITAGRMKTGTPVRIDGRSVHYDLMETQDGENDFHRFSFMSEPRKLKQLQCWTCFTNEEVHEILRKGLPDSPLFNGQIQSIGPRYCPSIETKIPGTRRRNHTGTLPERVLFFTAHGHTVGGIEESTRI